MTKLNNLEKLTLALLGTLGGAVVAAKISSSNTVKPTNDQDLARTSVMITRMDGRSGGSGVILHSGPNGSEILTNAHVCGVLKNGGRLTTDTKVASVVSYKVSEVHDLCLISTKTNLGVSTSVSVNPPLVDSLASVSGHPQLYPTITTHGHFSRYVTIPIMVGLRPCTEEEQQGDLAVACLFIGGIPIIKLYESQVISATIQPGSSGSPVFTENGEIGGLVFAGAGELSYGFIVPQEYVKNFVDNEVPHLTSKVPNTEVDIAEMLNNQRNLKQKIQKLLQECEKAETPESVKKVCNSLTKAIVLE